jgi:hypothetical protein
VSYSQPVAVPRKRPGVVTAAAYLMILVAVLIVVSTVVNLSLLGTTIDAMKKAYAGVPNFDQVGSFTRGIAIAGSVFYVLVAVGYVVLALFNLRGANPARIVTWVLAGVGVLCFGCGLAQQTTGGLSNMGGGNTNGVDVKAAAQQVADALPSWAAPLLTTIAVVNLLAVIVVIILLALPAANEFFRKRPEDVVDPAFPQYPYPPAQ